MSSKRGSAKARITSAAYCELFKAHKIHSIRDLSEQWEKGFKNIFASPTFLPKVAEKDADMIPSILKITPAQLEEMAKLDEKEQREYLKNLDEAFKGIRSKSVCEPLLALIEWERLVESKNEDVERYGKRHDSSSHLAGEDE